MAWYRSGGSSAKMATGSFTSGANQYDKVEINCGFKPDYVIVKMAFRGGYSHAMYSGQDTWSFSYWDLRPIENTGYLLTLGQATGETGISDITDTGFKYRVNASNTRSQACEYIAIKF